MNPKLFRMLKNTIRTAHQRSPEYAKTINNVKQQVQVGLTKKGLPKYRVAFKCDCCRDLVPRNEIILEHIEPLCVLMKPYKLNTWEYLIVYADHMSDFTNIKPYCKACKTKKDLSEKHLY